MLKAISIAAKCAVAFFACAVLVVVCSFRTDSDCYQAYEKMINHYKGCDYENFNMAYTTYSVMNGEEGGVLNNEVIKNKAKIKFFNQYMEMYQDEKHVLVVAKDRRQIVIQKAKKQTTIDTKQLSNWQQSVDTLKKYYKPLQCTLEKGKTEMTAELKEAYKEKMSIRRMVFVYESQSGKLHKSMVESEQQGTFRQEHMNIIKFTSGHVPDPFAGSVADLLAKGSVWKEKYKTYKIIDLRSK
jgi:hypothetical protein